MARRRWKMDEIKSIVTGENPFKQWGYETKEPIRKPGDRWTDVRGKDWEQKNGYKVTVNKNADLIRGLVRQTCSRCKCDIRWGNRLDRQFFKKSTMCYNCTIEHDTILRITGEWDTFEKKKVLSSQLSYLKDVRNQIKDSIEYLSKTDGKMSFVTENGDIETWTNTQVDTLLSGAKNDYEKLTVDIEDTEKLIESLNA